jgi:hypothetical protein
MKREVERKLKLPAFSISVSQLGLLMTRLLALFEGEEKVHVSIDATLKNEKLSFESIGELTSYPHLRGRITDFSIWLSQYGAAGRRVSILSGSLPFDSRSTVSAKAETEAWCAGAIETVHSFLMPHRLWYHWFVVAPIGWILFFLGNVPTVALQFAAKGTVIEKPVVFAWLAIVLTLFVLWIGMGRLLPSSILRVTEEDGFIRRHASELSLLIALASAVLTIVGWFIGKAA